MKKKPNPPAYRSSLSQALEKSSQDQRQDRQMMPPGKPPMRPKGKAPANCK